MLLSEAIEQGRETDLAARSLERYGYPGDIADAKAVVSWLRSTPHVDIDVGEPKPTPTRRAAIRDRQDDFRKKVGDAYGWRCAITGCAETAVLQAAHLRDWKTNNTANDGILLRADLHALMDAGKLRVLPGYTVEVRSRDYMDLDGKKLRLPRSRQDWPRL